MKIRDHYDVRIRDSAPPIGTDELDLCEASLDLKLPTAYREFLLLYNGGKPTPGCFLVNHAVYPKIDRFYSLNAGAPEVDLGTVCQKLRADFQLPIGFVPIARIIEDCILLLCCSGKEAGNLYYWPDIGDGFRLNEPDFDTVFRLYFTIDRMLQKLGPARNREDTDALFFRLYWVASNAQSGANIAQKFVEAGYDINFVIPGFDHPVFGSIKCDAFNVAQQMVSLGTRPDHVDLEGVSVVERLDESLAWWKGRLEDHKKGDSIHEVATRRIRAIEAALSVYSNRAR